MISTAYSSLNHQYPQEMAPAAQDTKDTRTIDFLNDKIQTVADLSTLENLLSSVKGQQELLRRQVAHNQKESTHPLYC